MHRRILVCAILLSILTTAANQSPGLADEPGWGWTPEEREAAQAQADEAADPCYLPPARPEDLIVLLGIYQGEGQPTVTVLGQDEPTGLIEVEIEDGPEPIYLLVSAYEGTIWRITGATQRLSRIVAVPRRMAEQYGTRWAGAGVTGVDQSKVGFAAPGHCGWYYYKPDSVEGIAMQKAVTRTLGYKPDIVLGAYSAVSISVPSGELGGPGFFATTEVWNNGEIVGSETDWGGLFNGGWELIRHEDWLARKGGIDVVDLSSLVANGRVEPYEILPGQDGLRQLVAEGKLLRRDGAYRIVQPIPRFPAGLSGAHSVTFLLADDIPMPKGSPGHSRVIVEQPATQ